MDFLKNHIEKIVFGLFLLGLLYCCVYLLTTLQKANTKVAEVREIVQGNIVRGGKLEPLSEETFDGNRVLLHEDRSWRVPEEVAAARGAQSQESLFDPLPILRCRNAECFFLLGFDVKNCPHCGTLQTDPTVGPELVTRDMDRDKDAIPNDVEDQYEFLDPDNAEDAKQDSDGDGFNNLEEYKAGTKMEDPASHPSLVKNRLFFGGAQKHALPFMLKKFVVADEKDPKTWELHFSVYERGAWRTRFMRIGDTVSDHKILAGRPKTVKAMDPRTKLDVDINVSEVQLQKGEEEPFWIVIDKPVLQRDVQIRLVLLKDKWSGNPQLEFVDVKLEIESQVTNKAGQKESFVPTNLISVNNEWVGVEVTLNKGKPNEEKIRLEKFDRGKHLP